MWSFGVIGLIVAGLLPANPASAQGMGAGRAHSGAQAQRTMDVSGSPRDLQRIYRQLQQPTTREKRDGLNLRSVIEVFGQAPPLVVFTKEDNLLTGPVPYGAPTHREMIEHVTPREYRAPAADFSALLRWLADRARKQ